LVEVIYVLKQNFSSANWFGENLEV